MGILSGRRRGNGVDPAAVLRLEERRRTLAAASEEWRAILREMEGTGESGDPRYETYFQAYIQARQQEKRVELELFNLRQGLTDRL